MPEKVQNFVESSHGGTSNQTLINVHKHSEHKANNMPEAAAKRNILIVGAGIGGLAAALALHTDGHTVTVIDSAAEFVEVCFTSRLPVFSILTIIRLAQAFVFLPTAHDCL
jgi:2-polyprenyl-3-methyl-5-hydroxy-6-metoxy-1,4-benzoquinol methylase